MLQQLEVQVPAVQDSASSLNFEIIALNAEFGMKLAPLVREHIESALAYAYREVDYEAVKLHIKNGSVQLWVVYDKDSKTAIGAATTLLHRYDLCYALRILTLAGKQFPQWREAMLNRLELFAEKQGATRIEASGRRGWAKTLQPLGFEQAYVTYIKEL